MSTILKALRRLEEDRSSTSSRPLREAVTSGGADDRKRRGGVWLLAGVLGVSVGLAAGGAAYWMASRESVPPEPANVAVAPRLEPPARAPAPLPVRELSEPAAVPFVPEPLDVAARAAAEPVTPSRDLSPAALTSEVERVDRPLPKPRIAAPEEDAARVVLGATGNTKASNPASQLGTHKPGSRRSAAVSPEVQPSPSASTSQRGAARPAGGASQRTAVASGAGAGDAWDSAASANSTRRETSTSATSARVSAAVKPAPQPIEKSRPAAAPKPTATPVREPKPAPKVAAKPAAEPKPAAKPAPEPKPVAAATPAGEPASARPQASAAPDTVARAEVPGVRVEKTFWHPSADRRTALIEVDGGLEEIQEGDAVGPLVVSTIEPSGVVFQHEGVEIRRRIGE